MDNAGTDAGELVWDVRAGVRYPLTRGVALALAPAYDHANVSIPVVQPGGGVLEALSVSEPVVSIVVGLRFTAGARVR